MLVLGLRWMDDGGGYVLPKPNILSVGCGCGCECGYGCGYEGGYECE